MRELHSITRTVSALGRWTSSLIQRSLNNITSSNLPLLQHGAYMDEEWLQIRKLISNVLLCAQRSTNKHALATSQAITAFSLIQYAPKTVSPHRLKRRNAKSNIEIRLINPLTDSSHDLIPLFFGGQVEHSNKTFKKRTINQTIGGDYTVRHKYTR